MSHFQIFTLVGVRLWQSECSLTMGCHIFSERYDLKLSNFSKVLQLKNWSGRGVCRLKCILQKISLVAESQNQSFVCPFRCLDCQNGNVPSPWNDNSGRVQGRWNKKELCTEFEQERCGALIEAASTANAIKEHKLLQQVNLFSLSSFWKWIIE